MSEENYVDDDFSLIILSKVDPEKPLPAEVFLKVDGKYIKFRNKGDSISSEKFDLFVSKGIKNIYVHNEDIMEFLEWLADSNDEEVDQMVAEGGEENRGFFERTVETKEKVYEVYFEDELNDEIVGKLQENVEDFIDEISKNPITAQAIQALSQRNNTVAEHSVNVANLAVYLAMVVGHSHQFVLENVYMGAIFHDYGKAKIPAHILENVNNNMYSHAIQEHPNEGVKILRKTKGIPEQVMQIIVQHHEQFNGHGFPRGLAGDDIYELAQIVSMANVFDNTLYENKNFPKADRYKKAIKVIEYDNGKCWNPKYIPRILDALTLAFGEKKMAS
ncbi:MAG: HD domain-containing protein [Oligoflexia bacterium]|nr:HD domain-containing protein [Oligoflexia bacterium]